MIFRNILPLAVLAAISVLPIPAEAAYQGLVKIPGVGDPSLDLSGYINVLYALSISVAALLAVIKIVIAGVKYMLTDIVTSKQDAKSDIRGALIGLLIVAGAFLILFTINPQLTNINLGLRETAGVSQPNPEEEPGLDCPAGQGQANCGGYLTTCVANSQNFPCDTISGECTVGGSCTSKENQCTAMGGEPERGSPLPGNRVNLECDFSEELADQVDN